MFSGKELTLHQNIPIFNEPGDETLKKKTLMVKRNNAYIVHFFLVPKEVDYYSEAGI